MDVLGVPLFSETAVYIYMYSKYLAILCALIGDGDRCPFESKVGDLHVGGEYGHFDLAGIVVNINICIHTVYIYTYLCLFIHNAEILLGVMGDESRLSTSQTKVIENRTIFIEIWLQQWLTQKPFLALF